MIDPIQFKPYNPRKDNQPIYAVDQSKGMDANRRRILDGMAANESIRRQSDATKQRNAITAGENIQKLGQFSETLANLGTDIMNRYIDAEEDKAIFDSFNIQEPPSQEFFEVEAEADKAERETAKGLAKYEEAGGSPIISEAVRTGSWWYNRKRNQLELQDGASQFPLWFDTNKDQITVNVEGQDKTWGEIKSSAEFSAFRAAAFQQYASQFRGYDKNAMAAYLFPTMRKAWGKIQTKWMSDRTQEIALTRETEAKDALYSGLKTPDAGKAIWDFWQLRMKQGLSSAAARAELGKFLIANENLLTPDALDAIEQFDVDWNDGSTKKLGKVLERELGQLEDLVADNINRDLVLAEKELQGKREAFRKEFDLEVSQLKEPLTADRIEKIKADWEADGLGPPPKWLDDYLTREEKDEEQELLRLQSLYDKQGFLTPNDLNSTSTKVRNNPKVQKMVTDGRALEGQTKTDRDAVKNRAKGLTNDITKLAAEDRNGEKYYQTLDQVTADLERAYREEIRSGKYTTESGTDYAGALNQAAAKLREMREQGLYKPDVPESYGQSGRRGDAGYLSRLKSLRQTLRNDPSSINTTSIYSTTPELEQAQKKIVNGTGSWPAIYVDLARNQVNVTPYDIAMAQLNLMKYDVKPPRIEVDVKKQDAAVQRLLNFHNTPNRTERAFTTNMNDPAITPLLQVSDNFNPEQQAFLNTVMQLEGAGYNTWFGGRTDMDLSQMTVSEVVAEQRRRRDSGEATYGGLTSAAVGAGQFLKPEQTVRQMGLDPNKVKYTPELQNKMIIFQALKARGVDVSKGISYAQMEILNKEWASFGPYYGQTKRTVQETLDIYNQNLRKIRGS